MEHKESEDVMEIEMKDSDGETAGWVSIDYNGSDVEIRLYRGMDSKPFTKINEEL